MHVVHIYKDYDPVVGGIENHIKVLAEGLAAHDRHVTVLVTNTTRTTVKEVRNNVTIIKCGRLLSAASTPLSLDALQHARTIRADIVHLHMPYPPGDLLARAVPDSPPLIITYHSDIVRQKRLLQMYRPLLLMTLRRARRIIATSAPYIDSSPFLQRHAAKCRVVPLSVDVARFAMKDETAAATIRRRYLRTPNDRIVLSVGVLRYYKGLHLLLDAMTLLDATLVLVGTGPEEQQLRDLAQAYGIARRVHFVGSVSDADLPAYYHAADVFVLPSHLRAEAFGIVQLEALAAGLPVVSTELGTGTSVANQHGETGFVVPSGDPEALARAIEVLLANTELRAYMSHQARQRAAQHYTYEQMIDRTLAVYREAIADD